MSRFTKFGHSLYTGRRSLDFVGHRTRWYAVAAGVVIAALLVLSFRGLQFGVEFTGGTSFTLSSLTSSQANQQTVDKLRDAIGQAHIEGVGDPSVSTSGRSGIVIEVGDLTTKEKAALTAVIKDVLPIKDGQISPSTIGASWGKEVAQRAIIGVVVFLVLVMLFIALYFREWKMALAAFIKLCHDLAITIGIYSLSGFVVSPAAVTGFLAILGFSLYDTVVVFDKVRENTHDLRSSKLSYGAAANLAVNQTLVRSINTGVVALIPIGAILWVSAVQLGASTLKDLALAQFVGMAVGVYSSVCIAPRILVHLKSKEKDVVEAQRRADARAKRADKYADVPVFHDGMPVTDAGEGVPDELREDAVEDDLHPASARPVPNDSARGRGRNAPEQHRPIGESGSSGRPQPKREPRSKRK